MINLPKKIHESTAISIPEVRKLLIERSKEGELSYMQRIALEHAQLVTRIEAEDASELIDTLIDKFQLSRNGAITLANYIPENIHSIRQLLGKEATLKESETLEEILSTLMGIKRVDKKDKSFTDALDKLDNDEDLEEEEEEKIIDESMVPDDI